MCQDYAIDRITCESKSSVIQDYAGMRVTPSQDYVGIRSVNWLVVIRFKFRFYSNIQDPAYFIIFKDHIASISPTLPLSPLPGSPNFFHFSELAA